MKKINLSKPELANVLSRAEMKKVKGGVHMACFQGTDGGPEACRAGQVCCSGFCYPIVPGCPA
jgi:hypothetical protein